MNIILSADKELIKKEADEFCSLANTMPGRSDSGFKFFRDAIYDRLVPLSDMKEKRTSGIAKGAVTDAFFEPLPEDELRQ